MLGMNTRTRIIIVVSFGAMAGLAFFYLIPRSLVDTTRWPSTTGTIVQAAIGSSARSGDRGRGGSGNDYSLRITYAYVVAGVRLENNSRSLLDDPIATSSLRKNLEILKDSDYSIGRSVRVYYDPRNPKRSVLDDTPVGWGRRIMFIGLGFGGCIGVLAGLFGKPVNPRDSY